VPGDLYDFPNERVKDREFFVVIGHSTNDDDTSFAALVSDSPDGAAYVVPGTLGIMRVKTKGRAPTFGECVKKQSLRHVEGLECRKIRCGYVFGLDRRTELLSNETSRIRVRGASVGIEIECAEFPRRVPTSAVRSRILSVRRVLPIGSADSIERASAPDARYASRHSPARIGSLPGTYASQRRNIS